MDTINYMGILKNTQTPKIKKGKQGFASMSRDEQRKIASKGGKIAHQKGTAHKWTTEEARAAGKKGGQN